MLSGDPKIISLAFITGVVPSLVWLWFWLREDRKNPEPAGLLALVFILGAIAVLLVLPIQKFVQGFHIPEKFELVVWASVEDLMKFLLALLLVTSADQADEPTDWPIYLITIALGFAALENIFFLM